MTSLAEQVAVDVMGWELKMPDNPEFYPQKEYWWDAPSLRDDVCLWKDQWHPDAMIDHAWLVVEHMERRGLKFNIGNHPLSDGIIVMFCGRLNIPTGRVVVPSLIDVPKAICEAALAAVRS